ncbi:MAG: PAS domain S-box protein [Candidatus Omnitrophica bacterium]|nr:PAS domain S-box protein [Candidatus Omnitrophota bacterium]
MATKRQPKKAHTPLLRKVQSLQRKLKEYSVLRESQKRAEDALAASEARYRAIVDSQVEMVCRFKPGGIITFVNKACCESIKKKPREVVGKSFFPYILEEDRQKVKKRLAKLSRKNPVAIHEQRILTAKGDIRWEQWANRGIFDKQGRLVEIQGVGREVTAQKRAVEALKESEEKFRVLADQLPNMVFINKAGIIVYANKKCVEVMGYSIRQLCSPRFDFRRLIAPESRSKIEKSFRQHLSGREVEPYEYTIVTKKRKKIDVLIATKLVDYEGDKAIQGIITDISAQKRVEADLLRQQQEQELILDTVPAMIFYKDCKNNMLRVNKNFGEHMGMLKDQIEGKNCSELWPEQAADYWRDDKEVMKTGQPKRNIVEKLRTAHGVNWIETTKVPCWDSEGNIIGVIGFAVDITERRKAEELISRERERLINILDSVQDGVYIANADYTLEYTNPVIQNEYGEIQGKKCYEYFQGRESSCPWCKQPEIFRGQTVRWEWQSPKTGKTYDLIDTPLKNPDGTVSKLEIFRDITERKKMELELKKAHDKLESDVAERTAELVEVNKQLNQEIQERKEAEEDLRQSEARLADAQRIAHIGNWTWDIQSDKIFWSDEIYRIFGVKPQEFKASFESFLSHVHPDDRLLVKRAVHEACYEGKPYAIDYRAVQPDETVRIVHAQAEVTFDVEGKPVWMIGVLQDITESKQTEKDILEISSREQHRIGQDLHDGLGQHLAGLMFMCAVLEQRLKEKKNSEAGEVSKIGELLKDAMAQAKALARGLHPVELEDNGLMAALQELARDTERIFHVACVFGSEKPILVYNHETATHLYRIAQEAVHNAIRHGTAQKVKISLSRDQNVIFLRVTDNGVGFPKDFEDKKGMGLRIMRYRTSMIDGSFDIFRENNETLVIVACQDILPQGSSK